MNARWIFRVAAGVCFLLAADVRADFLIYKVPLTGGAVRTFSPDDDDRGGGGNNPLAGMRRGRGNAPLIPGGPIPGGAAAPNELRIVLPGRVQKNPGRTVSYFHPTVKETLYFSLDEVQHIVAPTPLQEFNKKLAGASKNAEGLMSAARFALKKGLLPQFHLAIDKTLAADPKHEAALRIKELKKQIDEPCADNADLEAELRSYVKNAGMQVATSKHFIMLHDTPAKAAAGQRKNRSQERLDLLEQVYESFLYLFHSQDIALEIPRDRLKVVLFREQKDFDDFAKSLHPTLSSASGFWESSRNVSVFYDHATDSTFEALEKLQDENKKAADEAKRTRSNPQVIRLVKTLELLLEVSRDNADITVVTHEATHQMAANTGLLPRQVEIPRWVHEGLATYFETPSDAAWAGIGAISDLRLEAYRSLQENPIFSNIDFIITDQFFDFGQAQRTVINGYGQAWALTHFLMENHLKELVAFYRILGEMPADVTLSPALLTDVFNQVFGSDRKALDQEWRQYMKSLKTEVERIEEAAAKRGA